MRGRDELGLSGQDLMLYQMGEVVQIGVSIETALQKWIDDCYDWFGVRRADREMPQALKGKIKVARQLLPVWRHSSEHEAAIAGTFTDTFHAMQRRNRVIHDQWVSFPERVGKITRLGYFADIEDDDGNLGAELFPGIGPGEYTHENWEDLRTELWHCWWRLSTLTWVRPEPDGSFFFGRTAEHFELIRGEFYLGRDYMVRWSLGSLTQSEADAALGEQPPGPPQLAP